MSPLNKAATSLYQFVHVCSKGQAGERGWPDMPDSVICLEWMQKKCATLASLRLKGPNLKG